jgi:hypothetical protein
MVVGINEGEGSSVGAWGEFIFRIQVQVLFERSLRGWSYKVEGAFGTKSENNFQCTKCPSDIQSYLRELQRVRERKKIINEERLHRVQSTIPILNDEDEKLQELL